MTNGHDIYEASVASRVLGRERRLRICLPASYHGKLKRRYPVLYVHDGQNAFSTAGEHVAFGWGNWQLDRTAHALADAGRMSEIILVAIDCSEERYAEYRGPAAQRGGSETTMQKGKPTGSEELFARYSRYLREELKPRIDREYRTRPGPRHTGTLGSSMGGVCSLALGWQSPGVFGNVASLSGAFQVERQAFVRLLRAYAGPPKPIRVYLDSGVVDYSGGDDGCKHSAAIAQELRRIGWRDGLDLLHYTDDRPLPEAELEQAGLARGKWAEAQTSQHNEFYWRLRAWRALTFLFPPEKKIACAP